MGGGKRSKDLGCRSGKISEEEGKKRTQTLNSSMFAQFKVQT